MTAVNAVIRERLSSEVALVNQLSHYIIDSGGKRLRPILAILAARTYGYEGATHHLLAAIVEFIHTATLLHDDVVDESDLRRGRETANALFGNAASVLVGDFLYSRAFEMMVDVDDMRVMAILANTTNVIAEGEVMQLMNVHDADTTEENYLEVIQCKTAKLFEAATRLGAVKSRLWLNMACTWEPRSSLLMMYLITAQTAKLWAKMWVMTWQRASPRCR
jgi:octaprenyl-diphosphate synthase